MNPPVDGQLGVLVDLLPGLRPAPDEPREDERLRLRARLGQAAFDEQDVESFLHGPDATLRA